MKTTVGTRTKVIVGLLAAMLATTGAMGTASAKQPADKPTPPGHTTKPVVQVTTPGVTATSTAGNHGSVVSACVHLANEARKAAQRAAVLERNAHKKGQTPAHRRATQAAFKTAHKAAVALSIAAKRACRTQPPGTGATPTAH